MNRTKRFFIASMAVALVFLAGATAMAQQRPARAKQAGLARMFAPKALLKGLNLTPEQRTQVRNILASHKSEIAGDTRDLVRARLTLRLAAISGAADLQGAASNLVTAQVKLLQLRQSVISEIKPILTPEQLARLEHRQQLIEQRLKNLLDRANRKNAG